jgi:hypothetical protein
MGWFWVETHEKLVCSYWMRNNKAFTLINGGKTYFFYSYRRFLPGHHQYENNIKNFLKGKVDRDIASPIL